jgi:hypothetical protein
MTWQDQAPNENPNCLYFRQSSRIFVDLLTPEIILALTCKSNHNGIYSPPGMKYTLKKASELSHFEMLHRITQY